MELVHLLTPRGVPAQMYTREDTSDLSVCGSVFAGVVGSGLVDEYNLADLHMSGGRFVDVGAHIGAVTVAVLLDNPAATALCIEPLAENIKMLRLNLKANGLEDRATVVRAAAGTGTVHYDWAGDETMRTNRFIGNLNTPLATAKSARVKTVALADLLPADAMKLDCEGGEWSLLTDPRIAEVYYLFGEYHGAPGIGGVIAALKTTHQVEFVGQQGWAGNFRAVAVAA